MNPFYKFPFKKRIVTLNFESIGFCYNYLSLKPHMKSFLICNLLCEMKH